MTVDPCQDTFQSALRTHSRAILDLLRQETPLKAALVLEQNGWPRDWSCAAIRKLEVERNPAGLPNGSLGNQARRDRLNLEAMGGALLLGVGIIAEALFLLGGRISIWPIVAVIFGAGACSRALPELKKYPDRRLPTYTPPKELRGHQPGDY